MKIISVKCHLLVFVGGCVFGVYLFLSLIGREEKDRDFCKLIRATETGLVNWSQRFSDRMLLMIGNFSMRYLREQVSWDACAFSPLVGVLKPREIVLNIFLPSIKSLEFVW